METTPNEFLQFAKDMGLGRVQSTSLTPLSTNINNNSNNGYTLTGLSALNNLCHLIEDIHKLKAENDRLRAHLELINQTEKFILKNEENDKLNNSREKKTIHSTLSIHDGEGDFDEDKSSTLSPSNSLKIKKNGSSNVSLMSRERHAYDFANNNHEELSSMLNIDHDQSKLIDHNLGASTLTNWNKMRHAFSFSLRRKTNSPPSPLLSHTERTIPAISISNENDDDNSYDNMRQRKRKTNATKNNSRRGVPYEDTDQDDEYIEFSRVCNKRELYRDDRTNSSSNERQESTMTTTTLLNRSQPTDGENLLRRKPSKIAHYRRKLRSKLDTVKKQFSDPNPTSSPPRFLLRSQASTFDEIGSGLNHALLTAQLAPAMTKSYQQKMRDWEIMQKSNFLVDYRRQSFANKVEINNNSRKGSIISTIKESSNEPTSISADESIHIMETNHLSLLSPILSPNQRSFLVHQWREIMSEEISIRRYNEYLQNRIQQLKRLETDLKSLKTSIFYTNNYDHLVKYHSMTSIERCDLDLLDQYKQTNVSERCRSFQSLIAMPNSWILAVQSAAYSDILDGTSRKTTERAILFNKKFFHQLNHFKDDRQQFEQDTANDLQAMKNTKTNISFEENFHDKQRYIRQQKRIILNRGCLRKLSLVSPIEIPQTIVSPSAMIPCQTTTTTKLESLSQIELLPSPTHSEPDPSSLPSSSMGLNKRSKRSRFGLKKTLQRSKSMCISQFNSWLQRHRQQHQQNTPKTRRKSAADSKTTKEILSSACSTPRLLGSPRLARIHQKIFKLNISPSPPSSPVVPLEIESLSLPRLTELPLSSHELLDDSDEHFQKKEPQVRIYLPARTSSIIRRVRITDNPTIADKSFKPPPMEKIVSPILTRRNLQSAMKTGTIREQQATCTDA